MRAKSFDHDQALDAAMLQFWESGFDASSMQCLVERMGISRQSLYDTYGNKRDLFRAALVRYRSERIEPVITEIRRDDIGPLDALRAFLIAAAQGRPDAPSGCLVVRCATEIPQDDSAVADFVAGCIGDLRGALCRRIEEGQQTGEIVDDRTADELSSEVTALGIGLQVMNRLPHFQQTIRPTIESSLAALVPGEPAGSTP